ncbi:MAG: glycosyltransferase [Emcibacteraceae bacterium]|nr:glycosyltransferase [Emcibacteraceae bacterium]
MQSISCIIPIHLNTEVEQIDAALMSVFGQSLKIMETIISVDGPISNEMSNYLQSLMRSNETLIIVTSDLNRGAGAARNRAIDAASGAYLMFLDADDLSAPTRAFEQLQYLIKNDLDGCYSDIIRRKKSNDEKILYSPGLIPFSYKVLTLAPVGLPTLFIKKDVISRFRFPEHIRKAEDYWLFLSMMVCDVKLGSFKGCLYIYSLSEDDLIRRRGLKNALSDVMVRLRFIRHLKFFEKILVALFCFILVLMRFAPKKLFSLLYRTSFRFRNRLNSTRN